jgi:hypothetical protein
MNAITQLTIDRRRCVQSAAGALLACSALVACLLAGCGGSGSSGFDGAPASEPEAIVQAVAGGGCVEFAGVTYCGSGAPFTIGGDSGAVTIDEPQAPVACEQQQAGDTCVAALDFAVDGFPSDATYLLAVAASADGPWARDPDVPTPAMGDQSNGSREASVELPTPGGAPPQSSLVIAVLVYAGEAPAELPLESAALADFAPDVAYVSRDLEVAASAP